MPDKIMEKLKQYNNICILGFGREGQSTYNFIRRHDKNIKLTILDSRHIEIDDPNAFYVEYHNTLVELEEYDLIIKTPGIALNDISDGIRKKITSQIELLLEFNSENVIGITGTKGKSTTSTLIYNVLKDQGKKVLFAGNIGIPVLDVVEDYEDGIVVAEMSSHQLEFVTHSPHIGIVLNLFVDHLDHAGTIENYHKSKMNILKFQKENDYAIYDVDNYYLKQQDFSHIKSKLLTVSLENSATICLKDDKVYLNNELFTERSNIKTKLKGDHNLKNILFVLLVSSIYGLNLEKTLNSIDKFTPLEHRMEYVGKFNGINFYDDAIATIPEATINACKSLNDVDTLIIGGMDRNINYDSLIEYLNNSNISNVICMPTTGYKIAEYLNKDKVKKAQTLEEAVDISFKVTKSEKICLLSPAASSYEYFKSFEEKGNKFKELVKNYK